MQTETAREDAGPALEQLYEPIYAEARLPNDRPQGASIQFPMVGYDDLHKRIITPRNHMAALLPFQVEP